MKLILTLQASSYSISARKPSFPSYGESKAKHRPIPASFFAYYDLKEGANLSVSRMEKGLTHTTIYDQRHTHLARKAKAVFLVAELGGQNVIVHSYGKLEGDKSTMQEKAVYAARGDQHLDFFCHIDHIGKKTNAEIDIKGALADTAKKIFRGTLNFKKDAMDLSAMKATMPSSSIPIPRIFPCRFCSAPKTTLWGITHPAQDSSMPIRFTSS